MPKCFYAKIFLCLYILSYPVSAMAVMSSVNYKIDYEEITSGGNIGQSENYQELDSIGEAAEGSFSSDNYITEAGLDYGIESDKMRAPSLENNGSANSLDFTINRGDDNPSDAEYAIVIIEAGMTTFYVQADDTIGSAMVWQTYANWGGATGEVVTKLRPETEYTVKIKARQGDFTETEWSTEASATTSAMELSFNVSKDRISLGSLVPNIVSSDSYYLTVITNAEFGYLVAAVEDGDLRMGANVIDDVADGLVDKGIEYGIGLTDITGTDRAFSDDQAITNDKAIMSNAGRPPIVITGEVQVTHKAVVNQILEAGEYRHKVNYVCTSTF